MGWAFHSLGRVGGEEGVEGRSGWLLAKFGGGEGWGGRVPSFWSSLRPMSRKPTASIQAWLRRAMAS